MTKEHLEERLEFCRKRGGAVQPSPEDKDVFITPMYQYSRIGIKEEEPFLINLINDLSEAKAKKGEEPAHIVWSTAYLCLYKSYMKALMSDKNTELKVDFLSSS